jgi:HK97 family phage major capsid protein
MSLFQIAKDDSDEAVFAAIAAPATNTPSGFPYLLVTNWSGQIVASTTSNAFVVGDVHALEDALPPRFRMNAKFLAAQATYSKIRLFDTSGGAGLWEYIGEGRPNRLLGHEVYESPSIDSTFGSGENYTLFLGDFSQSFIIGDRLGTTVELIPHLFGATNNLPTGQRALFMNWRTGTQVGNQSAAVVLNVT